MPEGTVLGVVTIELSVAELLTRLRFATIALAGMILLFVPILLFVLNRVYRPVVDAAENVEVAVLRASEGDFSARVPVKKTKPRLRSTPGSLR